jgi:hypothetical protein
LEREEIEMLVAVRDVWCQGKGIPDGMETYQQILLDLIDWYQSGTRSAEEMYVRLGLQTVARAGLAAASPPSD